MRLSSDSNPAAKPLAFHPKGSRGVCIRVEQDLVMIMWNDGSRLVPLREVSTSWRCPADDQGRSLPVKLKRPMIASALGYSVVDVEFL